MKKTLENIIENAMTRNGLYDFVLMFNDTIMGTFVLFSSALREAEYLINESEIDPDLINEIKIVRRDYVQDHAR